MKRTLFLLITALYCLTGFGQESKFLIGVELLPTISTIWTSGSGDLDQARIGFSGGVKAEYNIAQSFSLKTGLMYELKGTSFNVLITDENGQMLLDGNVKTNYNYLILPILASFNTKGAKNFYVNAGPYLGYLLNKKIKNSGYDTIPKSTTNVTEEAKKIDFGLSVGIGLNIPFSSKVIMDLGLIENLGLINVSKDDFSEKTNSFGFKLCLKYKL